MNKELCINTDFSDDFVKAGRPFDKQDLDDMMKHAASLGASRYEWIFDPFWGLYENYPLGFDLLTELSEAAHRHGLRFYTTFKPFEGAGVARWQGGILPHTFPRPQGIPLIDEVEGLVQATRPFTAAHPEMRLARRPGDGVDPGGRITSIHLIKGDDGPVEFDTKSISIWTSQRNGGFKRYDGPMTVSETVEWRMSLPLGDQPNRIIMLSDLELAEKERYILIRCEDCKTPGSFYNNDLDKFVELVNESGQIVPSTPSSCRVGARGHAERIAMVAKLGIGRYASHPDVREWLQKYDEQLPAYQGMFNFNSVTLEINFDCEGEVCVARGKPQHSVGALNPVYPEVRQDWLSHVRFCIDRGVDGVIIRLASHNRPREPWAFGFNEPVLARMKDKTNAAEAARINGDAYTQFLHEAKELLHQNNREIGVHINGQVFFPDYRHPQISPLPRNIEWQWETWIREIADFVELRGGIILHSHLAGEAVDKIGALTLEKGIPFIYQSTRSGKVVHHDGPYPTLEHEMARVKAHPAITGYNLYESSGFMRLNKSNRLELSCDIGKLIQEHWWEDQS